MPERPKWLKQTEMLIPPLPWDRPRWQPRDGESVVLLHGLWRGWHAMEPLARTLREEGFSTLNLPYPSTRLPIPKLVQHIRQEVEKIATDTPIHFITHSLGGILVRAMLTQDLPWETGRLVMLAPPNSGSEIIDWSSKHPIIHRLVGPAGRQLSSDGVPSSLPPLPKDLEAAVIMGNRCNLPLFKHLLESENDGIVSACKGHLPGLRGFTVINADHTFIQAHPEAQRLSLEFLKSGQWHA